MKRMICMFLLAAMMALSSFGFAAVGEETLKAGDTILFGAYEQDNNPYNGLEPIEWIVLETRGSNCVRLISAYVLDAQPYDEESMPQHFAFSTLFTWLNEDFFNAAFSPEAQAAILSDKTSFTLMDADGNTIPMPVLLIDHMDMNFLIPVTSDRIARPTEYALAQGAEKRSSDIGSTYWIQSIVSNTGLPGCVSGSDGRYTDAMPQRLRGVRPMIYIDPEKLPALEDSIPEFTLPTPEPTPAPTLEPIVVSREGDAIPADPLRANVSPDDPIYPLLGQFLGIDEDETYNRLYFYADGYMIIESEDPDGGKTSDVWSYELANGKIYLNGGSTDNPDGHLYEVYFDENGEIYLIHAWYWTRYDKISDDVSAVVEHIVEVPAGQIQGVPEAPPADHLLPDSLEYRLLGRFSGYYYEDFNAYVFHADGTAYVLEDQMNDLYMVCSYTMEDGIVTIAYPGGRSEKLELRESEKGLYLIYPNDYYPFFKE